MWGELSSECGASCLGASFLWGELSLGRVVLIDLWTFRDLDFSRVVLSRPMIGPFATWYFSHLFDPSWFATSVIFAVCCQLTVNYSLTTSCAFCHLY